MDICSFPKEKVSEDLMEIAVIFAVYKGKIVFVKNKGRGGWEMPAGHREKDEHINVTASRELREETGAVKYEIKPLCDYMVTSDDHIGYGRLFYAKIYELSPINDSEVEEIGFFTQQPENLVYPDVQSALFKKAISVVGPLQGEES